MKNLTPTNVKKYVFVGLIVILMLGYAFGFVAPETKDVITEWVQELINQLAE